MRHSFISAFETPPGGPGQPVRCSLAPHPKLLAGGQKGDGPAPGPRRSASSRRPSRPADRDRTTVGESLGRWLPDVAVLTCRATTLKRYEEVIRRHLAPHLGRVRLARLTTPDVTRAWAELHRTAGRPGR
jgi:hypothetical protein